MRQPVNVVPHWFGYVGFLLCVDRPAGFSIARTTEHIADDSSDDAATADGQPAIVTVVLGHEHNDQDRNDPKSTDADLR